MPMPDSWQLRYITTTRTIPCCWTLSATIEGARGDMDDLFAMTLEPITSVWLERWESGILKETIHLYPDCAAEALAS